MAATNELSIKLLIDAKAQKVCFGEAGSDVVEFLSGLLSLPLGTVTDLLSKERMVGSVGNVLGSMEKLDAKYKSKGLQLSPAVGAATLSRLQQLLGLQQLKNGNSNNDNGISNHLVLYTCKGRKQTCTHFLSVANGSTCPSCSCAMNKATRQVLVNAEGSGYTVGDDLSVTPSANVVSGVVTLLAQYGVKDLKEKTVKIGKEEALGILAASKSKTVLTDVFLRKMTAGCKRKALPQSSDENVILQKIASAWKKIADKDEDEDEDENEEEEEEESDNDLNSPCGSYWSYNGSYYSP
ncbi:hypothetical protein ACQ4PT_002951 [Festuca glaucescens]